ncbi:hypothetical protein [Campylobacter concisus]|jgi:hypothetical protein|uniref:hypothetical protein n=1 Tax=Campylobacter concisus TaxID=199 RepID=UPI003D1CF503
MAEKIMSSIINAFIDIALRRDFAFFHYIFYNFYILFFLRISVDCLKDEVKEQKKLKEVFKWGKPYSNSFYSFNLSYNF